MVEAWAGNIIGDLRAKKKMEKKGAVSKATAKTPKELGVHESVLKEFERYGWVGKTADGRYYLKCEDKKHC